MKEGEIKRLITHLPTFPQTVREVLCLLDNPNITNEKVASAIAKDPHLSARILTISNSAFYGFPHRISSISHAVLVLGLTLIKSVVLSTTIFHLVPSAAKWLKDHACQVATLTFNLATNLQKKQLKKQEIRSTPLGKIEWIWNRHLLSNEIPTITTAALLHDIGKSIIAIQLPERFEKIKELSQQKKCSFIEAEREILGFDHTEVNKVACEHWHFPENLKYPIVCHHLTLDEIPQKISQATIQQYTALIHIADRIANNSPEWEEIKNYLTSI